MGYIQRLHSKVRGGGHTRVGWNHTRGGSGGVIQGVRGSRDRGGMIRVVNVGDGLWVGGG